MSSVEDEIRAWEIQSAQPTPAGEAHDMTALAQKILEAASTTTKPSPSRIAADLGTNSSYVSQVLRRHGIRADDRKRSTDRAAIERRAFRQAATSSRPCMCCGKRFWSEGPHNRLCDPCRLLPTG